MSARGAVFIATSLDGYIARPDGSLDWLNAANASVPAGEDCGYADFMKTVDALVMGRLTFETVLSFADWPYGTTPVVVLSRTLATLPPGIPASVTVTAEAPAELAARLGAAGMRRLYVDGGETIRAFLAADLIDEITLTTIPVLLGAGRPLFAPGTPELALELVASRHWPFGFVQNRYRLRRR